MKFHNSSESNTHRLQTSYANNSQQPIHRKPQKGPEGNSFMIYASQVTGSDVFVCLNCCTKLSHVKSCEIGK